MHNVNPKNNIMQEATSHKTVAPEPRKNLRRSKNLQVSDDTSITFLPLILNEEEVLTFLLKFVALLGKKGIKKILSPSR